MNIHQSRVHGLIESQNLLEAIASNSALALFVTDDRQECIYMNTAAELLTGYSLDELRGRPLHDVIHHTRTSGVPYPLAECPIDRALPTNLRVQGEEIFIHKDGHFYHVAFTASPLRDPAGKALGTVIEVQDVTEQKKAQQELNRSLETLRTLNDLGKQLSAELDLEKLVQRITDIATKLCRAEYGALFYSVVNPAGESYTLYAISGVPREAFSQFPMPRKTKIFTPTFSGEKVVRSDNITLDPRYGKSAPHFGKPQGHLPVVSYLAVPVVSRSGEVLGGLFFGHAEAGVFTQEDESLVVGIASQAAVAIDNARLYKRSQDAINARDEFLSIASHELKTPLTSLKLQAQLHKRAVKRNDPRAYEKTMVDGLIDQTEKQVNRLNGLVDDMLDVSRIRAGRLKMKIESFDLEELVREVVRKLEPQLESAGYETPKLRVNGPTTGNWDRHRLEQVLTNLMTNAIKYGKQNPIAIELEGEPARVVLKVCDRGIGIESSVLQRIFDRFERAINANEVSGLGLGLFITKQLVTAHGGKVWVESVPNEGSTFFVELPKSVRPPAEEPA